MRLVLLFLWCLIISNPSWAKTYICPALKNEVAYKGKDSYQFLIDGNGGWVFRTKTDFKDSFVLKDEAHQRLRLLNDLLLKKNVRLMLVPLPTRGMMHGDHILKTGYNRRTSIQSYRDLVSALRADHLLVAATEDFDHQPGYYYQYDHHWRPEGARNMAAQIAAALRAENMTFPRVTFKTESQGLVDHVGTFSKLIMDVCASTVPAEKVENYATYLADADNDLLVDRPTADIILVGTSNSTPVSHANFDGFLKQAIGTDIENMSISGGGADTALLQFLNSERLHGAHPPRLVIWEFPVYQGFAAVPFLDKAIAAVKRSD